VTKPSILPKKIYLPLAITELGLDSMPVERAIDTILLYSMNDNVSIYFDDKVEGIDSNIPIGEMIDDASGYSETFIAEPNQVTIIDGKKAITRSNVYSLVNGNSFHLNIYGFSQNNINYSIPDESGADLTSIFIDYNSVYFDQNELFEYINEKEFERETRKKNQLAKLNSKTNNLPTYLDPNHELYSPELALAIKLHKVIYEDKYGKQNINRKDRIALYLDKETDIKLDSAIQLERLSTIIGIIKKK